MRDTKCNICGKMYRGRSGLEKHSRVVHGIVATTTQKPIECPLCREVLPSRQRFVSHYLDVHGPLQIAPDLLVQATIKIEKQAVQLPLIGSKKNDGAAKVGNKKISKISGDHVASSSKIFESNNIALRPISNGLPRYNRPPDNRPPRPVTKSESNPVVRLNFKDEPKIAWNPVGYAENLLDDFDDQLGREINISQVQCPVDREVVLGIDFGTSCTKVVLGDPAMRAAYAVPFTQMVGVSAYLLPTHLGEKNGIYSLKSEGVVHNDLKLSMLSDPTDVGSCARVSAYLALVIRAARAWIFSELKDKYLAADLLWSIALGQPVDQATSQQSQYLFKKLGEVAWFLASHPVPLTPRLCFETWRNFDDGVIDPGDVEILVMPELAAQIHGFVSSTEFDPKHPNIYLLVDVGAGTIDASVFKVKKTTGGKTSFDFFTNAVEAYGAMNLHRHRVGWWQDQLKGKGGYDKIIDNLEKIRLPTEYRGMLPESYRDYIDNVTVTLEGGARCPDQEFFQLIRNQVAGKVLFGAKKQNLLDSKSIKGMPFFLCGGGARYGFYQQLKTEMKQQPGCSWLNALYRELTLPSILRADGVSRMDFDRLSVAYGLSQLRLDTVNQVRMMQPLVPAVHESDWKSNYVEKDAC